MEHTLYLIGALLPAFVLHEYAHGWMAYQLGDDTAKRMGRLTLNPIAHLDPVGSFLVPLGLYLAYALGLVGQLILLAWGKPVPVNYRFLNNPRHDMAWVALAGPAVNIILAFLFSRIYVWDLLPFMNEFLAWSVAINLGLAVFNLVPIPPLDGSRILMSFLPLSLARPYSQLERYGILIILLLLNFGFFEFILPFVKFLSSLIGVHFA